MDFLKNLEIAIRKGAAVEQIEEDKYHPQTPERYRLVDWTIANNQTRAFLRVSGSPPAPSALFFINKLEAVEEIKALSKLEKEDREILALRLIQDTPNTQLKLLLDKYVTECRTKPRFERKYRVYDELVSKKGKEKTIELMAHEESLDNPFFEKFFIDAIKKSLFDDVEKLATTPLEKLVPKGSLKYSTKFALLLALVLQEPNNRRRYYVKRMTELNVRNPDVVLTDAFLSWGIIKKTGSRQNSVFAPAPIAEIKKKIELIRAVPS